MVSRVVISTRPRTPSTIRTMSRYLPFTGMQSITFVAPDEEPDLRGIEKAIGKRLPRVTLPDFDYTRRPIEKLEIPIHDRIAAIRAKKAEDRARATANAERRARRPGAGPAPSRSAANPNRSAANPNRSAANPNRRRSRSRWRP